MTDGQGTLATTEAPHTDHHAMAFDANGDLLDGNDGGIWRFSDALNQWTNLNGNLDITQFEGVSLNPVNADLVYGGARDNGVDAFSGAPAWQQLAPGDDGPTRVDPTNVNGAGQPPTIYEESDVYTIGPMHLMHSDDGGVHFSSISPDLLSSGAASYYPAYALDPPVPSVPGDNGVGGRILYGSDALFESLDYGKDWKQIATPKRAGFNPNDHPVGFITVAPSNPDVIYVSIDGRIFVTSDDGGSWTEATPLFIGLATISGLAVGPSDPNHAYAVVGTEVFETANGTSPTATWTDISGNLPGVVTRCVLIDPRSGSPSGRTVYVGTDTGVYFTPEAGPGATWQACEAGLPNAQVVSLDLSTTLDNGQGVLLAGTHGRGAWEIIPRSFKAASATPPRRGATRAARPSPVSMIPVVRRPATAPPSSGATARAPPAPSVTAAPPARRRGSSPSWATTRSRTPPARRSASPSTTPTRRT